MISNFDIINFIQENKAHNLPLVFKDTSNNKIYGFDSHYVVENVYFIIANESSKNDCSNYLHNIDGEAMDECWNCHIDEDLIKSYLDNDEEEDYEEDYDIDNIDEDTLYEYRKEVVIALEILLYIGEFEDFDNCNTFREMISIEINKDNVCIKF